ncbi:NINE protein [Paenibacillus apiarius]|uniref:TM2 domain-containing protein n=1 Tax=Paenibacillus apiarius TaxID=46240 RepID=A0ABT4DMT9_9BACL|nr:TM2 domain-containing protein [Paenibacillus apiarius]MCY9514565.1 TM2 domain-containing protein [Paenibacillus apiarius]MCY9518555.1 TM2 domain-containing protein [Paenibacillus apiarius]MCY9552643.1 TM2 domain-containing protein [Paenibacillus apiarius]MCY9557029.1 TM2 domain-containing protein [Paenibacillus apiarius]MCY9686018.1 TM2 domain-containing protein [Paenibacillus apiarius]
MRNGAFHDFASAKRQLSLKELAILQSEMRHQEKSLALAYLMLIGGHLGVHRFYLRRFGSAFVQLVLFVALIVFYALFGVMTAGGEMDDPASNVFLALTLVSFVALTIWVIVDLFLVNKMVKQWNEAREAEIIRYLVNNRIPEQPENHL